MSVLEDAFYGAGWDESQHPRNPSGTPVGGQFARLYHVSPVGNRQSIREKGLLPDAEKRYTDSGEGVYTFGSRDEAWRFATTGERMYGDSDIWEVKNEGLALEPDPFFEPGHPLSERAIAQMGEKPAAFVTRQAIPPESLTLHPNPWHPDPETQHRLVSEALQSWVSDPATMRIHMANELNEEDPGAGPGAQMREQAAALIQEVREGGANDKTLYRGATSLENDLGVPESWTENRAVARKFAGKHGQVFKLAPGEARGIRMRDYISSGMDVNSERQWLIDPWSRTLSAAGWREEDHPRDPGGEGGGQFVPKGTSAADDRVALYRELVALHGRTSKSHRSRLEKRINNLYRHMSEEERARLIQASEEPAPTIRLPKFAEAKALQNRLYEIGADDELGKWVLDDWGEWTDEQQRELKAYLDKQLQEGGWENVYNEENRAVSRRIQSGLLSVDYSKEIGMSYSKERGQARSLVSALEKHIAYNEAIKYGFDPAEYAADLFGEEAIAARRKKPNISPRDQGIPEDYLSEKGTFKPGHDAKLKSDLVNSYFELDPKRTVVKPRGEPTPELMHEVAEHWRSKNQEEAVRQGWSDEELWKLASSDPQMPTELWSQVRRQTGNVQVTESTLIHRFDPKDAQRILEERGWTKFLDQKRDKLRGMIERTPEQANSFIPGLGDQVRSELDRAHAVWGDSLNVKGERFGLVQAQVGELAHLEPEIAKGLKDSNVKVYVGPGPSTDLDEMWHLSDERARGWGNTYLDKVGGFYSPTSRSVIVSATAPSSTSGLMAHEVGHAIGDVYKIDHHPELADHHHRVYNQVRSYFKQGGKGSFAGKQELWAEGVSAVLRNRMEGEFDRRVVQKGQKDTGPFIERDYDSLSPEAKEYLDWVDRTLREIAEGRHVAS